MPASCHPSRRALLRAATAVLSAAVLEACGSASPEPGLPGATPARDAFAAVTAPRSTIAGATGRVNVPATVLADRAERLVPVTAADAGRIARWRTESWTTNFDVSLVPYDQIVQAKGKRDAIPPLDRPTYVSVDAASTWLQSREPVIALDVAGDVRAYPLQIMTWHEIVNDLVGQVPVAVTYCPLCNSALVFDRRVLGAALRFGVTGNLFRSDLLMWDNLTESWWQQLTGEAVVGDLTGVTLTFLPAQLVAFGDFAASFPGGRVLDRETGVDREYGRNPYVGYDTAVGPPPFFRGELNELIAPTQRVVAVSIAGEDVAYTFAGLRAAGVINDRVGGVPVVVMWQAGTASALDSEAIAAGRDVGAGVAYQRRAGGQDLTFEAGPAGIRDRETGSTWSILGRAVSGPLAGQALTPVVHGNHFWFAWAAFKPGTKVRIRP